MKKIKKKALLDESKLKSENKEITSFEEARKIVLEEYIKAIVKVLDKATK